jgi:hypothetical protein
MSEPATPKPREAPQEIERRVLAAALDKRAKEIAAKLDQPAPVDVRALIA